MLGMIQYFPKILKEKQTLYPFVRFQVFYVAAPMSIASSYKTK